MTTDVSRVNSSASVLDAVETMNRDKSSGVAVFDDNGRAVGMITERRLLRDFLALNKRPGDVKVGQVMGPFYRIGPDASTKEAAKRIVENNITRLGVFEGEDFLGWITLTDLTREFGKKSMIEILRSRDQPEKPEFLCPNCRDAFMEKVLGDDGNILRWRCPSCKYSL
jgi:signal-transduction protein with cAMP-binding, CBS, and nucleotidyltransferase domain